MKTLLSKSLAKTYLEEYESLFNTYVQIKAFNPLADVLDLIRAMDRAKILFNFWSDYSSQIGR